MRPWRVSGVVVTMFGLLSMRALPAEKTDELEIQRLNPAELPKLDYLTHVTKVRNGKKFVHIAGQTAINTKWEIVGKTADEQADEALKNLDFALQAGGARKEDIVRLTVLFVDNDGNAGKTVTSKLKGYFKATPLPAIT
jgi:enamine deaminase RidA (YjgF/YER057c/UK114 family)